MAAPNTKSIEITCPACGIDSLLKREPVYDGFKKVGEKLSCSSCRHEFATEADVPFKAKKKLSVFSEDDKPKVIDVFKDEPKHRNCRYCEHYVVNPFTQRCGLTQKIVQATDICEKFEPTRRDCGEEQSSPPGQ